MFIIKLYHQIEYNTKFHQQYSKIFLKTFIMQYSNIFPKKFPSKLFCRWFWGWKRKNGHVNIRWGMRRNAKTAERTAMFFVGVPGCLLVSQPKKDRIDYTDLGKLCNRRLDYEAFNRQKSAVRFAVFAFRFLPQLGTCLFRCPFRVPWTC